MRQSFQPFLRIFGVFLLVSCASSVDKPRTEGTILLSGTEEGKMEFARMKGKDTASVLVLSYDSPRKISNTMKVFFRDELIKTCQDNELKEVDRRSDGSFKYSWKNDVDCRLRDEFDTLRVEILDSMTLKATYQYFNQMNSSTSPSN